MIRTPKEILDEHRFDAFMRMVNRRLSLQKLPHIEFTLDPITYDKFKQVINTLTNHALQEIDTAREQGFREGQLSKQTYKPLLIGISIGMLLGGGLVLQLFT